MAKAVFLLMLLLLRLVNYFDGSYNVEFGTSRKVLAKLNKYSKKLLYWTGTIPAYFDLHYHHLTAHFSPF